MFVDILMSLIDMAIKLLKWPVIILIVFIGIFLLMVFGYTIYWRVFKGVKKPKPKYAPPKITYKEMVCRPRKVWEYPKILFLDVPKQLSLDKLRKDPTEYPYYGLKFVCGKQGNGKSFNVAQYAYDMKGRYPDLHIASDMKLGCEDLCLESLDDIPIDVDDKYCGSLILLDEMQILSSQHSFKDKNYNIEFIHELACQQRKKHREIVIVTQIASNVDVNWRRQMYYFLEPHTFFGCLTVVLYYEVSTDSKTGDITKKKLKLGKSYVIPHTDENRNRYDTMQIIRNVEKTGLRPQVDSQPQYIETIVPVIVDKKGKPVKK